ncbi:MAG: hypothetical protein HQL35_04980 [Alphaproteobacteria bacterium]|nr:hypothetical protein [Alphaproteobacteria bacterium]
MKMVIAAMATALAIATATDTLAQAAIEQTLASMSPLQVEQTGETLTVVLPQDRITHPIYTTAIGGVCMALFSDDAALDGIREMRVLNRHAKYGMVAEGGKELCTELNALPVGKEKANALMIVTHTF